jgi:hypothetical protein
MSKNKNSKDNIKYDNIKYDNIKYGNIKYDNIKYGNIKYDNIYGGKYDKKFTQEKTKFTQGIKTKFTQGKTNFTQGKTNFTQGKTNFTQGKTNFIQGKTDFIQGKTDFIQRKTNNAIPSNIGQSVIKAEGYVEFSKQVYSQISMHKINLINLDINNRKILASKLIQKSASKKENKHWTTFDTWEKLQKNPIAKKEYLIQKNRVINDPNLDWSDVLKEIMPKLKENREYIGVINIKTNSNKLYIVKYEGSPTSSDEEDSDTTFASIPSELVNKYSNMVALFMFHTHPEDIRGSPLPSSHDLSAALYFGSISRFASSIIISRYGVLMYGLSLHGYNILAKAKDYNLAVLNLSFDIISAHESIRSWNSWKLDDYVKFYEQYKMFMYIFPTPEYISDNVKLINEWNISQPVSYDLIMEHYSDINNYTK